MHTSGTPTSDSPSWYAVYTKPRWEKKVAELLGKNHIEHYCPLNRVERQWSDRKKIIDEPLFTSYVFVKVSQADQWRVKAINGILNFVHWLNRPARIPDEDINLIKQFLQEHQQVKVAEFSFKHNDRVRILSGPFINQEAQVSTIKGKQVQVLIPSLSLSLMATIKTSDLEII